MLCGEAPSPALSEALASVAGTGERDSEAERRRLREELLAADPEMRAEAVALLQTAVAPARRARRLELRALSSPDGVLQDDAVSRDVAAVLAGFETEPDQPNLREARRRLSHPAG